MVLFLKFVPIIIILMMLYPPIASAQQYFSTYSYSSSSSSSTITAQPNCEDRCGDVKIPYPFGMNYPECFIHEWFEIECRNSSATKFTPYLKQVNLAVTSIDVSQGTVRVMNPIRKKCTTTTKNAQRWPVVDLRGSPFVYSQDQNKFLGIGCNKLAYLASNESPIGGCVSICDHGDDLDKYIADQSKGEASSSYGTTCQGKYCCETSLPSFLSEYNATFIRLNDNDDDDVMKKSYKCRYAMIAASSRYLVSDIVGNIKLLNYVPAVLEWEILNNITTMNSTLSSSSTSYCYPTNITTSSESGWRCECRQFFYGNPYIPGACRVKNETAAGFIIEPPNPNRKRGIFLGIVSSLGCIILFLGIWRLNKVVRRKIKKKRRGKLFKRNGGLLLEQRLSSGEVNGDKVKHFSLKDLEKATDRFNVNRVLGKGGQATVYKGMLVDGNIVAVKVFKVEGNVEEFINEFVILSQINHRNVVKLLGCCLETEIPLLVYEFIPNGNLYEYLQDQNDELPMTWDMRLRIATEIAGALFYLHSGASQPIYHRDIKSTNILLDGKYKAKVADFGTSRMISIEATHHSTDVQGTFGYLDPEYFYTSQFTEKSDVYSFGVVLVELLTGEKPISSLRPQEAKSLAPYFTLCLEENRLFDIIDKRVTEEGENQHIIAVANLARKCLEMNGKKRPTMKDVTVELERIWKLIERKSEKQEHHEVLELAGIEDHQLWAAYSTSNEGSTLNSQTSTSEVEPILTK